MARPWLIALGIVGLAAIGFTTSHRWFDRQTPAAGDATTVAAAAQSTTPPADPSAAATGAVLAANDVAGADGALKELPDRVAATSDETACSLSCRVLLGDQPVAGATLRVIPWTDTVQASAASLNGLAFATVDAMAREFETDEQGSALLSDIDLPAFIGAWRDDLAPAGLVLEQPPRDAGTVAIEVVCPPGEVIRGRVETVDGTTLPNVPVFAQRAVYGRWLSDDARLEPDHVAPMLFPVTVRTDPTGRFAFTGLRQGPTFVSVDDPAHSEELKLVHATAPDDLVFVVYPGRARIRGKVVDEDDGTPIAGVLMGTSFLLPGTGGESDAGIAMTAADGSFEVTTRPDMPEVMLRTLHADYATHVEYLPGLRAGELRDVTLRLARGQALVGVVRDIEGVPVDHAYLRVYGMRDEWITENVSRPDGRFSLPFVAADGRYTILVTHAQFETQLVSVDGVDRPLEVELTPAARLTVRLVADTTQFPGTRIRLIEEASRGNRVTEEWFEVDAATGTLEFPSIHTGAYRFDAVSPHHAVATVLFDVKSGDNELVIPLSSGIMVRGRVEDATTGAGIVAATVALADLNRFGKAMGDLGTMATTAADGSFLLDHLPAGDFGLRAAADGYAANAVRVREGEALAPLRLERSASLEVTVIGRDGQPLTGLAMTVDHPVAGRLSATEPSAPVVRIDGIPPGRVAVGVAAHALNRQTIQETVDLTAGDVVRREFRMGGGARVSGRVKLAATLSEFTIDWVQTYRLPHRDDVRVFNLGSDACFAFDGLEVGQRVFRVTSNNPALPIEANRELTVVEGDNPDVVIEVTRRGFAGDVSNSGGERLGAAVLRFTRLADGNWRERATARVVAHGDGAYTVIGLDAGAYRVRVDAPGCAAYPAAHDVADTAEPTPLDIVLQPEAVLEITCHDAKREPLAAAIEVVPATDLPLEEPRRVHTDSDGRIAIDRMPAGNWIVTANVPDRFPARATCELAEGSKAALDLEMRALGSLELTVFAANGAAVADAPVSIADVHGGQADSWLAAGFIRTSTGALVTDHRGRLRIDGLPAGRLTVTTFDASVQVTLAADQIATRTIALP